MTNPATHIPARRAHRRHRGFTLVEAAFVTVVVGLSCAALMQLLAAGTVANSESAELTTAVYLANNIHEGTMPMSYAQVEALHNKSYSPPVDSQFKPVPELGATWRQRVTVTYVNPAQLPMATGAWRQPTARVAVTVSHNDREVYTTRWVVAHVP